MRWNSRIHSLLLTRGSARPFAIMKKDSRICPKEPFREKQVPIAVRERWLFGPLFYDLTVISDKNVSVNLEFDRLRWS